VCLQGDFLTPEQRGPYTFPVIRSFFPIITSIGLCACATDQVSRTEHSELLASVRALRAENARLENRLETLEQAQKSAAPRMSPEPLAGNSTSSGRTTAGSAPVVPAAENVPALTVVKLKPRRDSAPPVATEVEVIEPPEGLVTGLDAPAPTSVEAQSGDDPVLLEAMYQQGLDALKTGNNESGIAQLQQFAKDWPRHPRADNALYFAAVGLIAARDFKAAEVLLDQTVKTYPAGDAVVDALLKLADCRAHLNRNRDARATWERVVNSYPGTQAATFAQARLSAVTVAAQKE
jgi:tol-pal system protein YbgF